jgi:hypothetical protein
MGGGFGHFSSSSRSLSNGKMVGTIHCNSSYGYGGEAIAEIDVM